MPKTSFSAWRREQNEAIEHAEEARLTPPPKPQPTKKEARGMRKAAAHSRRLASQPSNQEMKTAYAELTREQKLAAVREFRATGKVHPVAAKYHVSAWSVYQWSKGKSLGSKLVRGSKRPSEGNGANGAAPEVKEAKPPHVNAALIASPAFRAAAPPPPPPPPLKLTPREHLEISIKDMKDRAAVLRTEIERLRGLEAELSQVESEQAKFSSLLEAITGERKEVAERFHINVEPSREHAAAAGLTAGQE